MRILIDLQGAQSDSRFRGIGRYSLSLAEAIASEAGNHEIWLALSGSFPDSIEGLRATFNQLIPAERIRVFEVHGPVAEISLTNTWRMQAAELIREKFLADLRPDIVHVSTLFEGFHNEVVASVGRLDATVPSAVTLYDLIPMLRPDSYLSEPVRRRHYLRRAQSLKRADLLLAISESTRREAIDAMDISPDRVITIGAGLSRSFEARGVSEDEKASLLARYGLRRAFVLYTGAVEPHKNVEGLIAAFGSLRPEIRSAHQLAIAGKLQEADRDRLVALLASHGLDAGDMVCLNYVPDEDLSVLYSLCAVFIFPSLHEGFGLPILEAMACGAPVIGSNCTSIPEIINRKDALFDPRRPQDIANRLKEVLSNTALRQNLKVWGLERARAFTWDACARKTLEAFEELSAKGKKVPAVKQRIARRRQFLGFVSPLPPKRTGIAGYCAKLLPNLARHYEIVCIVAQPEVTDPWITSEFAVRDVQWFEANSTSFDRIVYHFGNSSFHKHMFALLQRHPGVVVLHDFYLSDVLNWMTADYARGCFTKALYGSHGFSALESDRLRGRDATTASFPSNADVLREAVGVVVHSEHAIELGRQWYGDQVSLIMRRLPFLPFPPEAADRWVARARFGLPRNAFVVSSFGFLAPLKLNHRLLDAWLASPLSRDESCFLVFVGENHGGDYGQQLLKTIAGSSAAARIRITGYVEETDYRHFLAASDLAMQLRTCSRGETSATIFDCLSRNVPLVINAHGSAAELPDDVVIKLHDDFTDSELSDVLVRLRNEPALRKSLAKRGELHVKEQHHPERVAELYRDAIEELYETSSVTREQRLLEAIARMSTPALAADSDLVGIASAIAANRERFGKKQILVDVTNVANGDLRTGIERVTRAILAAMISDPPPGYRVEAVRAEDDGYAYARRFACRSLGLPEFDLTDEPVETGHGDIFIGLDWCADVVPRLLSWFEMRKRRGLRVIFTIYDLLPILQPRMFPPEIEPQMQRWLEALTKIADGLVCISRTVADELLEYLRTIQLQRRPRMRIGFFHLGADLCASLPTGGLPESTTTVLTNLRSRPSFLMVGTVEPRKGHRQALAAMELLWADSLDANLVIIGKKGWMMEDLVERIKRHPKRDNRLFWLQGISDEMLDHIYRSARALLAASEGEGFGLPLIEAAQYRLPIIARDIPIFREVAGEYAFYFKGKDPKDLAGALQTWLSLGEAVPASASLPWLTWQQSSRQLLDVVLNDRWYGSWPEHRTAWSDDRCEPYGRRVKTSQKETISVD